jgi:mycothiol system anti-sigma-R factor
MHDCRETMHRLYQYLDRELSEDDQAIVQQHLDHCPPCRDLFRFEENVLTFISEKCREVGAPPSLRDKVMRLCQESS